MKAVIYARVSTDGQNVDNQTRQLKAWAAVRGWEIVDLYQEAESAWRAGHQSELSRLRASASRGHFDTVLVWSLDRLSREGALAVLQLVTSLNAYGVKVISYQEPWTEAPGELAEILYAITGWVARMESQRRSERTKAGLARVRGAGIRLGRPIGSKDKKKRRRRGIKSDPH